MGYEKILKKFGALREAIATDGIILAHTSHFTLHFT
jgi:hypothetical protein